MKRILLTILFSLSLSNLSFAAPGESGVAKTITQLQVEQWGIVVFSEGGYNNPEGCDISDRAAVIYGNPRYKELYALLLTAAATGKKVAFWMADCQSAWGTTVPKIINAWIVL